MESTIYLRDVLDGPLSISSLRNLLEATTGIGYGAQFEVVGEGKGWEMTVALPGIGKANIDVRDEFGKLKIWAFPGGRDKQGQCVVCSRLPPGTVAESITSSYVDGILTVKAPFANEGKVAPRVIKVE